jgi:hypothetical protein
MYIFLVSCRVISPLVSTHLTAVGNVLHRLAILLIAIEQ